MTAKRAALALLLVFAGLVASGLTGSSLAINLNQSGLVAADAKVLIGQSRAIRSDEWLVHTRMAIAQFNHAPRFPVVNGNLGPDGQNMLIVGMAGVPVAHATALVKPATWGFFLFDLRRALAWHWWLPLFGCVFALWGVMRVLVPGRWRLGLATALSFAASGYVAAWSNWPAYAVLFPACAFCLFHRMFEVASRWRLLALGIALGAALAGFVLVLYPPWQVPLGYLFLLLSAGVLLRDQSWRRFDAPRAGAIVLSLVLAALLVWAWWSDAKSAIEAIQATVYPGQRQAVTGGGFPAWLDVRGFLNHYTLYRDGAALNQSESGSFLLFFPVVIIAAVVIGIGRKNAPGWPQAALIAFCLLVLWFQFIGFAPALARFSLWGRLPPIRADLALGLASILLCAMSIASAAPALGKWPAAVVAAAWAAAVQIAAMSAPESALGRPGWVTWWLLGPSVFLLSWWLLRKQVRVFVLASLVVTGSMSLPFNPLVLAPSYVRPAGILEAAGKDRSQRVLVVGSRVEAMGLLAAGIAVANGVFYYPQPTLEKALDPSGTNRFITNRYQHLLYEPDRSAGDWQLELLPGDAVQVRFNPARFDFGRSGADRVLAPNDLDLEQNRSIELEKKGAEFSLCRVVAPRATPPR